MNYEFITTIATILLVGASIASLVLSAIRSASRTTNERFEMIDARFEMIDARFEMIDARFEKIDARFEKIDARFEQFEKIDARFEKIDEQFEKIYARFFEIQKQFTAVHAGIARLEGLIDGIRGIPAPRELSSRDSA